MASSARAHLVGRGDGLVEVAPLLERCGGRFADLFAEEPDPALIAALGAAETIGRPLGAAAFLDWLAALIGRDPRVVSSKSRTRRKRSELVGFVGPTLESDPRVSGALPGGAAVDAGLSSFRLYP